jgi:hypothetical protein
MRAGLVDALSGPTMSDSTGGDDRAAESGEQEQGVSIDNVAIEEIRHAAFRGTTSEIGEIEFAITSSFVKRIFSRQPRSLRTLWCHSRLSRGRLRSRFEQCSWNRRCLAFASSSSSRSSRDGWSYPKGRLQKRSSLRKISCLSFC